MPLPLELERIQQLLSAFSTKKRAFAFDPGAPVQLSAGAENSMLKKLLDISGSALRATFRAPPAAHGISRLCLLQPSMEAISPEPCLNVSSPLPLHSPVSLARSFPQMLDLGSASCKLSVRGECGLTSESPRLQRLSRLKQRSLLLNAARLFSGVIAYRLKRSSTYTSIHTPVYIYIHTYIHTYSVGAGLRFRDLRLSRCFDNRHRRVCCSFA